MSQRLHVAVPADLEPLIRAAAERGRMSAGEWLRRTLERALAQDRSAPDALARLASLDAPTGDIDVMLAQIEAGRS
jgi:hypothetical protein